jgi:hypothetical protein
MAPNVSNSREFFLWDYDSTLFPLRTNRLLVEKYSKQLLNFIQDEHLTTNHGGFQNQHRVFATKRGWFLRRTVKLDPVAEFFFYDFIYRNRRIFREPPSHKRAVLGYRIVHGEPIPILRSYSEFKKTVARYRAKYKHNVYLDVAAYFSHIYHHDLVEWCENAGGGQDEVRIFGKFLREISSGRSINCLPQGIYPSKMVGSAFLRFLEDSSRIRSARSVRLMDDMWLFDDDADNLIADFLVAQSLLSERGLCVNEEKSAVLEPHNPAKDLPPDLDQMKIHLLQKRREELTEASEYADASEDEDAEDADSELEELSEEEQQYLLSLLSGENLQEEDAELVLTLMRDHSKDVVEFIPTLIKEFPGLSKRLYYFCSGAEDKTEIAAAISRYIKSEAQVTEYQLFWFGMMIEDYLLKTPGVGNLLTVLYEHQNATDISRAKILEIPEKRFGLADLREEQFKTGHSDWLAWAAAVGARVNPKGKRNQLLKYFRKSSPMNRLIGEFVESCF